VRGGDDILFFFSFIFPFSDLYLLLGQRRKGVYEYLVGLLF
jgi:hypothetical protein